MTQMDLTLAVPTSPATTRRAFLKISGGAGAGLILLIPASFDAKGTMAAECPFAPDPFVKIGPDNIVAVIIKHFDKGQGAATGLSTPVAEELDAAHDQIRTEFAPSDPESYKKLAFGIQGVGSSTGLAALLGARACVQR
jgi:isoquinoline 1-oxidoreductase subunit beta